MSAPVPVGPEATLRALAAAMLRRAAPAVVLVVLAGTLLGALVVGPPGALGVALGGTAAALASAVTLVAMRATAHLPPHVVMMASFASFLTKMGLLLVALLALDRYTDVHRTSLALGVLAVVLTAAAAAGWASYRMPTMIVDPEPSTRVPLTSDSVTGMSESDPGAAVGASGPDTDGRPPAPTGP